MSKGFLTYEDIVKAVKAYKKLRGKEQVWSVS